MCQKKRSLFSLLFVFIIFFAVQYYAIAQTPVYDDLVCGKNKHIIWDEAGSPYLIKNNVWLPTDCTLMIRKGVKVIFEQPAFLVINGTLSVQGTKKAPVLFTSNLEDALVGNPYLLGQGDTSWLFIENGKADIRYAEFEWMYYGVRARNSNVDVRECRFSKILSRNIWFDYSSGKIMNNIITQSNPLGTESNYIGICIGNNKNSEANIVKIQHNQIFENTPPDFPINTFHAIDVAGSIDFDIDNNCIKEESGQNGISLSVDEDEGFPRFVPKGKITNNVLLGSFFFGIIVENNFHDDDPMISVEYNRITHQGTPDNLVPCNDWGGIWGISLRNANVSVTCNIVEGWDFLGLSEEERGKLKVVMIGIGLEGSGTYLVRNNWVRNNDQGFYHMMNPDGYILMERNQIEGNYRGIYYHDVHDSAVISEIRENNFVNNDTNVFIPTWSWIVPERELPLPPVHVENNYWGAATFDEIKSKFCCGDWTGLLDQLILFNPFALEPFNTVECKWKFPDCVVADQGLILNYLSKSDFEKDGHTE